MLSIFFRHKREGVNSIEMVFAAVEKQLLPHRNIMLPCEGTSPMAILKNIIFARRHRSEINHITGDAHYIALGLGRNTVLTVHDVQSALKVKNPLKRLYVKVLWFYLPALVVKRITVISNFTRMELERVIPFARNKITVVHNPFCSDIKYSQPRPMPEVPVILHLGTKKNKNLERTAQALRGIDCRLIILGKLSPEQVDFLDHLGIAAENYYDLAYDKVIELYRRCDIVSFPSTYEGFGMPVLEANAVGRPIIAGDIEALHEVAGDAALFVNPTDIDDIRRGFATLISDAGLRNKLVSNGLENVKQFSSYSIAEQYNNVYTYHNEQT